MTKPVYSEGLVYILASPSHPGIVKVGYTHRSADARRREYRREYQLSDDWTCCREVSCDFPEKIERMFQVRHELKRVRTKGSGTEMFMMTAAEAERSLTAIIADPDEQRDIPRSIRNRPRNKALLMRQLAWRAERRDFWGALRHGLPKSVIHLRDATIVVSCFPHGLLTARVRGCRIDQRARKRDDMRAMKPYYFSDSRTLVRVLSLLVNPDAEIDLADRDDSTRWYG